MSYYKFIEHPLAKYWLRVCDMAVVFPILWKENDEILYYMYVKLEEEELDFIYL